MVGCFEMDMHTPDELRERAAHARRLANEKTPAGRPRGNSVYLLNLAAGFEQQADLLERADQKTERSRDRPFQASFDGRRRRMQKRERIYERSLKLGEIFESHGQWWATKIDTDQALQEPPLTARAEAIVGPECQRIDGRHTLPGATLRREWDRDRRNF
jgi:hypothetical protein